MKPRYPALGESKLPYSAPPRVSVFLDRTNLIIDAYARHSLLKASSERIEAGLGVYFAPCDFRPARSFPLFTLAM
jgi:hypothetical protein